MTNYHTDKQILYMQPSVLHLILWSIYYVQFKRKKELNLVLSRKKRDLGDGSDDDDPDKKGSLDVNTLPESSDDPQPGISGAQHPGASDSPPQEGQEQCQEDCNEPEPEPEQETKQQETGIYMKKFFL